MLLDLHAHSSGISHCCRIDARENLLRAREAGLDGLVLTNHYTKPYVKDGDALAFAHRYVDEYYTAKTAADELGLTVIFGIELTMDGETDPMTKKYRQILTGRPIPAGSRVAVMKTSGTYVVLGQIENAPAAQNPEDLAPDAALGAAVSKINEILAALRSAGVFLNEEE